MAKKKSAGKSAIKKKPAPKKGSKTLGNKKPAKKVVAKKKPVVKKVVKAASVRKPVKKIVPKPAKKASMKTVVQKKILAPKPSVLVKTAAKPRSAPAVAKPAGSKTIAAKPALPPKKVQPVASPQAKPAAPVAVAPRPPAPKPVEKRPLKERVTMEFELNSAPNVLYDLISTPSGFSEWYCDDVDVRGDQYNFKWGRDEEATTMIGRKAPEVIRFHRNNDDDEAAFFEFRIRIDAMTNEVALIVTDHAWPGEVEETRSLWSSQIAALMRVLGA